MAEQARFGKPVFRQRPETSQTTEDIVICKSVRSLHASPAMIRFLHTRIRVRDLDQSVAFYQHLGYHLRDFKDSPQGNKLAFLALPGNDVFLELCHSPDYTATCPEDLMHTALGVDDIIAYCDKVEKAGIEIWPSGWRGKFSSGARKMAFVTDPDGYEVEILEK
jgi:lactoylglutathione lyase